MLIRPATSLIGVKQRQPALIVAQRFVGHGRRARLQERLGQLPIGGEMEIGEHDLAGPNQRPLAAAAAL